LIKSLWRKIVSCSDCRANPKCQVTNLLTQIQELKAVNDYEALQNETKIALLEKENRKLQEELEVCNKQKNEGQSYD